MTAIRIEDLSCGYGEHLVLDSLSLSIQRGEVFVLLGPNGAGKTTLLRALARALPPRSGHIYLGDSNCGERDLWSYQPEDVARKIALMPQSERRDWPLTVEESVSLGRSPHRGWHLPFNVEDHKIIDAALEETGLTEVRSRPITELSGGEWRRMVFARALAQQAPVLLLDEPTAGLDLKYQHQVLHLASELAKTRQLTVVMTLHDLNLAALYATRLALLSNRTLIAVGNPQEVLTAERIYEAYEVRAAVISHPVYQTPMVVPLLNGDQPEVPDETPSSDVAT